MLTRALCRGFRDVTLQRGNHATQIDRREANDCRTTPGPPPRSTPAEAPVSHTRRAADRRSRARRWHDVVAELAELQAQYAAWLDALPNNQQDGATADVLRTICELDLAELQAIQPPRGFRRD